MGIMVGTVMWRVWAGGKVYMPSVTLSLLVLILWYKGSTWTISKVQIFETIYF